MKKTLLFLAAIFLIAGTNYAQSVYKNAYLSTGGTAEDGTLAPSGYTWSELQHNAGDNTASNTVLAFTGSYGSGFSYSVADNFTVPVGQEWSITGFNTYVLLVGYTGTTSPIDGLRVKIYDGPPNLPGSKVVYGDLSTNRYSKGYDSLMYRIGNSVVPKRSSPVFDYKIWKVEGTLSVVLPAGNYWVEYQTHGVGDVINYMPPATILGARGDESYNGKQHNITTNTWTDLVDQGNPTSAPDYIQDMPFEIVYTNTLPVTFKSFDGVMQNGQSLLKWTTTNEINNKGFDVERSTDGQVFSAIGFVAGQGNSNVENNYTYTDVKPVNGVNYYRLKQIDQDGRFTYSSIIQLKNVIADFAWSVYPNPVVDNGWMQVQLPNAAKVSVQVISSTGNIISTIDKGTLQTGTYSIPLNMNKVAKGIYVVKLIVDNKTYSKTIVK
ncbi:MAG: T9SS type A sorting domain-containing protein [Chitinophagaceae bacterium]